MAQDSRMLKIIIERKRHKVYDCGFFFRQGVLQSVKTPNTACTRPSEEHRDHGGGSLRVFRQFARLEVVSVKVALSRPAHQRVTPAVGQRD
jgi:hypothetical protein